MQSLGGHSFHLVAFLSPGTSSFSTGHPDSELSEKEDADHGPGLEEIHHYSLHLSGQNTIPWPHLAAREAEKCHLSFCLGGGGNGPGKL